MFVMPDAAAHCHCETSLRGLFGQDDHVLEKHASACDLRICAFSEMFVVPVVLSRHAMAGQGNGL